METLLIPKVSEYTQSFFGAPSRTLKKSDISGVKVLKAYGPTDYKALEEITVPFDELKYYCWFDEYDEEPMEESTEESNQNFIGQISVDETYRLFQYIPSTYCEINDSNCAWVYCNFFGVDFMIINGTQYTK